MRVIEKCEHEKCRCGDDDHARSARPDQRRLLRLHVRHRGSREHDADARRRRVRVAAMRNPRRDSVSERRCADQTAMARSPSQTRTAHRRIVCRQRRESDEVARTSKKPRTHKKPRRGETAAAPFGDQKHRGR